MSATRLVFRSLVLVSASASSAAGCSEAADARSDESALAGGGVTPSSGAAGNPAGGVAGNSAGGAAGNSAGASVGAAGATQAGGNTGAAGDGQTVPPSAAGANGGGGDVANPPSNGDTSTTTSSGGENGGDLTTGQGSEVTGAGGATGSSTTTDTATSTTETGESSTTEEPEEPGEEDIVCPADATFCTGFELPTLPEGAAFEPQYVADMTNGNVLDGTQMALDTTVVRSGSQALHVPEGMGGYQYRMLAVPVPGNAFWVRLWVRTSDQFGDGSHDSLYMASRLPVGDYNGDSAVEISEQSNQMLLNLNDSLYSASGPGDPGGSGTAGPTLPANTWVCMESFFDAGANVVQVYADGELLIDAANYGGSEPYQTFRFGYLGFNDARGVWYDDVVVAASRIGCD